MGIDCTVVAKLSQLNNTYKHRYLDRFYTFGIWWGSEEEDHGPLAEYSGIISDKEIAKAYKFTLLQGLEWCKVRLELLNKLTKEEEEEEESIIHKDYAVAKIKELQEFLQLIANDFIEWIAIYPDSSEQYDEIFIWPKINKTEINLIEI